MRILVTGGTGFIGSHLCRALVNNNEEVLCLDNLFTGSKSNISDLMGLDNFHFIYGDVLEKKTIEVDQVYHLACPASPIHYQRNPVQTTRTGVLGTLNVLEMCREVKARFLITSTSEIYGDPELHPQKEEYWGNVNPIGIRSCYDESKRCAESLAMSFNRQYGVDVKIPRLFNTYGPALHFDDGRVVSNFILQALRGDEITIYGTGNQTRSFCYVSDIVEALIKLMNCDCECMPINIGNPDEFTINQLAGLVKNLINENLNVKHLALPEDDPVRRKPDINRAKEILNWEPKICLKDGLILTIANFINRLK